MARVAALPVARLKALDHRADLEGVTRQERLFLAQAYLCSSTDSERIRALGAAVLSAFKSALHSTTPVSVVGAHDVKGVLRDKAAVSAFGIWLIEEGAPGMPARPGKPMDRMGVLSLAAAVASRLVSAGRFLDEQSATLATVASSRMTDGELIAAMHTVVGVEPRLGSVKSLRKSAVHALGSFLDARRGPHSRERYAPLLAQVLQVLAREQAKVKAPVATKTIGRTVACLVRPGHGFTVAACYSDDMQAGEYQRLTSPRRNAVNLAYLPDGPAVATATAFHPDIDLQGYDIRAVFDRVVLTVRTHRWHSALWVKDEVDRATGLNSHVEDKRKFDPVTPSATRTDACYEILIQEPTPIILDKVLAALDANLGLLGEPEIALLELSLDFRVRDTTLAAAEMLGLREAMVAVLHRHHHHRLGMRPIPQQADRRQVFQAGGKRVTRPLHAHQRGSVMPLSLQELDQPGVADVILGGQPEEIFLNATVYDGHENIGVQVNLQHKIKDRRNPKAATAVDLDDRERRARMEVVLRDGALHDTFGIRTLRDLTSQKLRRIKVEHLSLFLPVFSDDPIAFAVEVERFGRGGVHVLDLYQRAAAIKVKRRTGTGKRGKLVAWSEVNDRTGEAVDVLARLWARR